MSSDFSILSGAVSHLSTTSSVQGQVRKGKGNVSTSHKSDFRIDGQAAVYNDSVNIADGDKVSLAGKLKGGEFRARALRNDETGVIYSGPTNLYFALGGFLVLIGVPLAVVVVGVIFIALGLWVVYEGYLNKTAASMLS